MARHSSRRSTRNAAGRYSTDGRFLAVVVYDSELLRWKPDKVFALSYPDEN